MKYVIIIALIAACWISPLAGFTIWNSTPKNTRLTLSSADKKKELGSVDIAAHKGNSSIKTPDNLTQMYASVASIVPARKQMTPIEPLSGSHGWLYTGHGTYAPLFPPKGQIIPDGATSSYITTDEKGEKTITRVDAFPEKLNESDTDRQTLTAASYAKAIDQKSYLMVTETVGEKPHLMMRVYDPKVIRKAAAVMRQKKNVAKTVKASL
jgi:hypothetical protein